VLEEPTRETVEPTPIVTNEVLINEGARKDGGEDLTVIDPAAKSPAPGSQYLGRVQVPPPASADASDASRAHQVTPLLLPRPSKVVLMTFQ
jgi:hypothetical protein